MACNTTADSEPLENALNKIADIINCSESDPELLMGMLNQIEGAVIEARNLYLQNVLEASRREKGA